MPRFSSRTNPKSIIIINKSLVNLTATRDIYGLIESYTFGGINFADDNALLKLPDDVEIILEISEDKNFLRVDLGTKGYQNKKHEESLDYFESRSKLKWYLFIKSGNNILARIENLEPNFPNDADSKGLVHVEVADLGEVLWRVEKDPSRPIIQVNKCPELDMIGKLKEPIFRGLVIINALEQFLELYSDNPIPDNTGDWQELWKEYFYNNNIDDIPNESLSDEEKHEWVQQTINILAQKFKLKTAILNQNPN